MLRASDFKKFGTLLELGIWNLEILIIMSKSFIKNLNKAHCIGAGGIGVSAVAKLLHLNGVKVTGYDNAKSEITAQLEVMGIGMRYGDEHQNLKSDIDLVIYSSAVPKNHPERVAAAKAKVKEFSYFEFLGKFSADYETIAVAGTHGKSTTTAMLGLIAEAAGLDPTVIVGSLVKTFPYGNLRVGKSKLLIVEACEYEEHFLELHPQGLIITNIEADHLDYFKNLDAITQAFRKLINLLPEDGMLVLNNDNEICHNMDFFKDIFITRFGIKEKATYRAENLRQSGGWNNFDLVKYGAKGTRTLADMGLKIPGAHNVANALAAASMALEWGVEPRVIKNTLEDFGGIWRRFERIGGYNGATIFSDYGHHPTAIRATVQAARDFYNGRRVVLVFQPHHHNRTKELFNEFVDSLVLPDVSVVADIYDVAGREAEADQNVTSENLVAKMKSKNLGRANQFIWSGDVPSTKILLEKIIKPDDIVIIMGAGNIYRIANELISNNS